MESDAAATARSRRRGRLAILAIGVSLGALGPGFVATAGAAAPSSTATALSHLKTDLASAARAGQRHKTVSAKAYRTIGQLTKTVTHGIPHPSASCRTALKAAGRLSGERKRRAKLLADVRLAHQRIGGCKVPKPSSKSKPPPATPKPTPPAGPTDVGGTVLNASGQPLANLSITVDMEDPLAIAFGKEWTTTTNAAGQFTLPWPTDQVQSWYTWSATASFPWRGGTWPELLGAGAGGDPAHLVFRSNPAGGAKISIGDDQGCFVMWKDPAYPASNPSTTSVTVTLTPDGPLIDGSTAAAETVTLTQAQLCDNAISVPAGAWIVSGGVDNLGRALVFSLDELSYGASVELFNAPPSGMYPTGGVDTHFATPPSN